MHREIEVVNGDGSNLEISPVSDHLVDFKPNQKRIENVIIPKVKKINQKKQEQDHDEKEKIEEKEPGEQEESSEEEDQE